MKRVLLSLGAAMLMACPAFSQYDNDGLISPDGNLVYTLDASTSTASFEGVSGKAGQRLEIPESFSYAGWEYRVTGLGWSVELEEGQLDDVTELVLPSSMITVREGVANYFPNLRHIYSNAVIPPFVSEYAGEHFWYAPQDTVPLCTLHVPALALDAYRADSCWMGYATVTGMDQNPQLLTVWKNLDLSFPAGYSPNIWLTGMTGERFVAGNLTASGAAVRLAGVELFYDRAEDYETGRSQNNTTFLANGSFSTADAVIEMNLSNEKWTFVSFPFDVKVSDIVLPDSADMVIRSYDAAARAAVDFSRTWHEMTVDSTLRAYQGYIIQVRNTDLWATALRFPAVRNDALQNIVSNGDVTIPLGNYPAEFQQNSGWNLVGNPYPAEYDLSHSDYKGDIVVWDGQEQKYVQFSLSMYGYTLLPGEAFFIHNSQGLSSITFKASGRVQTGSEGVTRGARLRDMMPISGPAFSVGPHKDWDPVNPGDPGCNLWEPATGRVVIDYYETGFLADAIENAIGLTVGKDYLESTCNTVRGRVSQIVVAGPFNNADLGAYHNYFNCKEFDLSRTSGWNSVPAGAFQEGNLPVIVLPACIDSIQAGAFVDFQGLTDLYLFSQIPPYVDDYAFDSIPRGVTVHVPAQSYPLYLRSSILNQMAVMPMSDQVGSISVNLPADWTDGRYKGMKVQVTSVEYGHIQSLLVTDRQTYRFNNLVKDGTYLIELKNSQGVALSRISDVVVTREDTQVSFAEMLQLHSATVKVRMPDGTDVTSSCKIRWYSQDGTLLGKNYYLASVSEGTELTYSIQLPERYVFEYALSDTLYHATVTEDLSLSHQMAELPKITLRGIVTDSVSGAPVHLAAIALTQEFGDGYCKSYGAQTYADGTFSVNIVDSPTSVTVMADGYFDKIFQLSDPSSEQLPVKMNPVTGHKVRVDISFIGSAYENEQQDTVKGYSNANDLRFELYGSESGTIENFTVQYPFIYIDEDSYQIHEDIFVTVSSSKMVFDEVQAVFEITGGLDILKVEILERGGLDIRYNYSESPAFNVSIFNSDGSKFRYGKEDVARKLVLGNLPEGTYTVVASAGKNGSLPVSRLDQLDDMELVQGKDFVMTDAYVSGGQISIVRFDTIPVLNMSNKKYLVEGSYNSDKVRVSMGGYTTLTARAQLVPAANGKFSNISAVFDLPAGCSYVEGSALLDGQLADVVLMSDRFEIELPNDGMAHEMRFCVRPQRSGNIQMNARVRLDDEGSRKQVVLGSASFKSEGISVKVPSMVNTDTITVWGTAPANSDIVLRDNGNMIGSTRSDRTGRWFVRTGLHEPGMMTSHRLSGHVRTPDGSIVHTDTAVCVHNPYAVYAAASSMLVGAWGASFPITEYYEKIHNSSSATYNMVQSMSLMFINGVLAGGTDSMTGEEIRTEGDLYTRPQSYIYFNYETGEAEPIYTVGRNDFQSYEFQTYFPGCDSLDVSDVVFHVELEDSVIDIIPASYKDGYWYAKRTYNVEGRLPVNVSSIEYNPHKVIPEEEDPYSEIREMADTLLNSSISQIPTDVRLNDAQLAVLDSLKGREYSIEEFLRTVASYPESGLPANLVEWLLTVHDVNSSRGVLEPIEFAPGYYSPRFTYKLADGGDITSAFSRGVQWSFEMSEDGLTISMRSSRGDIVKIESNVEQTYRANLIRQTGDQPQSQKSSIEMSIDNVGDVISKVDQGLTTASVYTQLAGAMGMVDKNVVSSFCENLGAAGNVTGAVGAFMDLKDAKEALERESGGGWYEMANSSQFQLGTDFSDHAREIGHGMDAWNTGVAIGHVALAAIAIVGIMAVGIPAVISATVAILCILGSLMLKYQDDKFQAESQNLLAMWEQLKNGEKTNDSKPNRDPSGFVYEAVEGNRLEGVTATLYQKYTVTDEYGKEHTVTMPWNADQYGQVNPQVTNASGEYGWDVPEGFWMVVFEKEGYATDSTEWLGVPPPQLDVNVGLKSMAVPNVYKVSAYEDNVVIRFSRFMRSAMLTDQNIIVTYNGKAVSGEIELLDSDWGNSGEELLASAVRFFPDDIRFEPGTEVTLFVAGRTQSYTGVPMESDFVQSFTVEREVIGLEWTSESEMRVGTTQTYSVSVYPAEASVGHKVTIQNNSPLLAVVSAESLSLDSCGQAQFTVTSLMTGSAQLMLSVTGTDITGFMEISILADSIYPAAPYAQYESGQLLQAGTSVALYTDSIDAQIYYTLDGTDPIENGYLYDEPILLDSTFIGQVTINAVVLCGGRWSNVATFSYTVAEPVPDGINRVIDAEAEEPVYDLNGRRVDNQTKGILIKRNRKTLFR